MGADKVFKVPRSVLLRGTLLVNNLVLCIVTVRHVFPFAAKTKPAGHRHRGRKFLFSFKEPNRTCFFYLYNQRRRVLPAERAACLPKLKRPYFTVPSAKLYIGVPSFQASFRKSDLYITVPPRSPCSIRAAFYVTSCCLFRSPKCDKKRFAHPLLRPRSKFPSPLSLYPCRDVPVHFPGGNRRKLLYVGRGTSPRCTQSLNVPRGDWVFPLWSILLYHKFSVCQGGFEKFFEKFFNFLMNVISAMFRNGYRKPAALFPADRL